MYNTSTTPQPSAPPFDDNISDKPMYPSLSPPIPKKPTIRPIQYNGKRPPKSLPTLKRRQMITDATLNQQSDNDIVVNNSVIPKSPPLLRKPTALRILKIESTVEDTDILNKYRRLHQQLQEQIQQYKEKIIDNLQTVRIEKQIDKRQKAYNKFMSIENIPRLRLKAIEDKIIEIEQIQKDFNKYMNDIITNGKAKKNTILPNREPSQQSAINWSLGEYRIFYAEYKKILLELQKIYEKQDNKTKAKDVKEQLKHQEELYQIFTAPVNIAKIEVKEIENKVTNMKIRIEDLKKQLDILKSSKTSKAQVKEANVAQETEKKALLPIIPTKVISGITSTVKQAADDIIQPIEKFEDKAKLFLQQELQNTKKELSQATQRVSAFEQACEKKAKELEEYAKNNTRLLEDCIQHKKTVSQKDSNLKTIHTSSIVAFGASAISFAVSLIMKTSFVKNMLSLHPVISTVICAVAAGAGSVSGAHIAANHKDVFNIIKDKVGKRREINKVKKDIYIDNVEAQASSSPNTATR